MWPWGPRNLQTTQCWKISKSLEKWWDSKREWHKHGVGLCKRAEKDKFLYILKRKCGYQHLQPDSDQTNWFNLLTPSGHTQGVKFPTKHVPLWTSTTEEIKVSAFLIRWFTGQKGCLVTGGLQDNFIVYKVMTLACSLSEYEYIYIYIFFYVLLMCFPLHVTTHMHTGANNFPLGRESPCRVAAVRLS